MQKRFVSSLTMTNFTYLGSSKVWEQVEKIPICSLRTAFSRFLDITTPPSVNMLKQLASQATRETDKNRLENLANVGL
jgi:hypothetical protein